ncbi:MAG: sulfate/molybdate ABC transporter ATP-binding protein [Selenomonadaceae bacterium]
MRLNVDIKKKLMNFELQAAFHTEGEVLALLGASGCGKSMTLKCIAGIETPDSGIIELDGQVLFDSSRKLNLPPQQRKVGYLFQNYALFPNMTVAENIAFVTVGDRAEKKKIVAENIRRFALENLENAYPQKLSGGQQQRVAFARILASEAKILLLDEPFSALDSYLKWQLEQEMLEILERYDGAALFVSHDRDEVYRLCDRVAVMNQGHIEVISTKKELFENPQTMAGTLLTGCKNISKARLIDDHTIAVEDWGLQLHIARRVPQNLYYAGFRAHFFKLAEDEMAENTFLMEVVRVIEDSFSYLVLVRVKGTSGKTLLWDVDKELWQKITSTSVQLFLTIPADKIILMEK